MILSIPSTFEGGCGTHICSVRNSSGEEPNPPVQRHVRIDLCRSRRSPDRRSSLLELEPNVDVADGQEFGKRLGRVGSSKARRELGDDSGRVGSDRRGDLLVDDVEGEVKQAG